MKPSLNDGDVIRIRAISSENLALGDILVTVQKGELVTHRLVAIRGDGWYTKGDNVRRLDPPVNTLTILGRVDAVERNDAWVAMDGAGTDRINRLIGWLSWQEGRTCQWLERLLERHRLAGAKWIMRLVSIPFRLTLWLILALRR